MRRVVPIGFASVLIAIGCATGGEATTAVDPDAGGPDASMDGPGGPGPTCVHNEDCTAPNLCVGNNGQACVGGFCVATGKPENCDDGVACTSDSCDANKNACVHQPNDAACPAGSYCDLTSNCVQTLPCKAGDSVCDRLNTGACDGTWSCDTVKLYCVRSKKPCPDRTNATTTCTVNGPQTTCSWACAPGFVDLNGDVNAAPNATSDGCECKITDQTDRPTLANVDGNCDGIVGNIARAIFVDGLGGNDGNAGTMASPKKTIQAGIAAAAAAQPPKDVYVSKGTYNEAVVLADGVSVFGGYDAATKWSRAGTNVTLVNSTSQVGVAAVNLTKPTEIQLVSIKSLDALAQAGNGDGLSSYGVRIVNSSSVTVRGCTITAGMGAPGALGGVGPTGSPGGGGGNASGPNGTTIGGPGPGCGGANGGGGGPAVNGPVQGLQGGNGTQIAGGGGAATGGPGGNAGSCSTFSSSSGFPAPPVTQSGGQGSPGVNGSAGPATGTFDGAGDYLPAAGGDGLTTGTPGGGGAGGGSGGGSARGTNFVCTDCAGVWSGAGGGGGGAGCGGGPGHGGRGGGSSVAIAAISSTVIVDASKMTTANAGAGGSGGNGGAGGGGGGGGGGGIGETRSDCSTRSGGSGANGGPGGAGGMGGGGAGGTGGSSVCIAYKGTSPTVTATQCTTGGAGPGGAGGTNGVSAAASGAAGVATDQRSF